MNIKLKKDSYKLYLRFGFNGRPTRISALGIDEEGDSLYITVVEKIFNYKQFYDSKRTI